MTMRPSLMTTDPTLGVGAPEPVKTVAAVKKPVANNAASGRPSLKYRTRRECRSAAANSAWLRVGSAGGTPPGAPVPPFAEPGAA